MACSKNPCFLKAGGPKKADLRVPQKIVFSKNIFHTSWLKFYKSQLDYYAYTGQLNKLLTLRDSITNLTKIIQLDENKKKNRLFSVDLFYKTVAKIEEATETKLSVITPTLFRLSLATYGTAFNCKGHNVFSVSFA